MQRKKLMAKSWMSACAHCETSWTCVKPPFQRVRVKISEKLVLCVPRFRSWQTEIYYDSFTAKTHFKLKNENWLSCTSSCWMNLSLALLVYDWVCPFILANHGIKQYKETFLNIFISPFRKRWGYTVFAVCPSARPFVHPSVHNRYFPSHFSQQTCITAISNLAWCFA